MLVIGLFVLPVGCLSYRYTRQINGVEINDPGDAFIAGQTTLGEVLSILGAPDDIVSLERKDLLIYERSLSLENRFSLGIPVFDVIFGGSVDVAASGELTRYDTLAFFFKPDGTLEHVVFDKGSSSPYLKTLLSK
jgi:hypothetical protein